MKKLIIMVLACGCMVGFLACGQKENADTSQTESIYETETKERTSSVAGTQEVTTEKEPEDDEYVLVKK